MSLEQQHRLEEVVRRTRPRMPKFTEHDDISGYCSTCQTAYRVGLQMFYRIAENIDKKEIMQHNVDIKIRHRKWSGENEANTQVTAMKIFDEENKGLNQWHRRDSNPRLPHCAWLL